MFGLLLRSIQAYLRGTFGPAVWARVLRAAGQPPEGFEPMLPYDARAVKRILAAAVQELNRPADAILEDVGTFLVADPGHRALRRLLRFGGAGFMDFLHSLEELPDRARLALPGLHLPQITLMQAAPGQVRLAVTGALPALLPVGLGALRAMADDYGALVLIDLERGRDGATLTVQLLEPAHGEGQRFALAQEGAADGG